MVAPLWPPGRMWGYITRGGEPARGSLFDWLSIGLTTSGPRSGGPRRGGDRRRPGTPPVGQTIPDPVRSGPYWPDRLPPVITGGPEPDTSGPFYIPGYDPRRLLDVLPPWLREWVENAEPYSNPAGTVTWSPLEWPTVNVPVFNPTPGMIPWEAEELRVPFIFGPLQVKPARKPSPGPTRRRRRRRRAAPGRQNPMTPRPGGPTRRTRPTPAPGRPGRIWPGQPVVPIVPPMFPGSPGAPSTRPAPAPSQVPSSPTRTRPGSPGEPPPGGQPNETMPLPSSPPVPGPIPAPRPGQGPAPGPAAPGGRPGSPGPKPSIPPWLAPLIPAALAPAVSRLVNPLTSIAPPARATPPPLTALNPGGVGSVQLPTPQPEPCPQPARERDKRNRKKRKRKQRNECWRGTYTETAARTIKRKKERVPCQRSRKKPQ